MLHFTKMKWSIHFFIFRKAAKKKKYFAPEGEYSSNFLIFF